MPTESLQSRDVLFRGSITVSRMSLVSGCQPEPEYLTRQPHVDHRQPEPISLWGCCQCEPPGAGALSRSVLCLNAGGGAIGDLFKSV